VNLISHTKQQSRGDLNVDYSRYQTQKGYW